MNMYILTYSYSYLQKVVIGKFLNVFFDSRGEILYDCDVFLEISAVIWANTSLQNESNASSFI